LVGLVALTDVPIQAGAHLVANAAPQEPAESLGHITSYTFSPALQKHIALALLTGGKARIGERLYASSPVRGVHVPVEVVDPCFFDPEGRRMKDEEPAHA